MRQERERQRAQTLLEFALILPILLSLAWGLIEFGLLFQAWLTVQNSAQAGTRYAVTGQEFADPTVDLWDQTRLQAIKDEARRVAGSLRIDDSASPVQPGYFKVQVYASDAPTTTPGIEYPGGPEARVAVDVTFNHELLTPVVRPIIPWIKLRAHSEMINERFRHPGYGTPPGELPPTILPTPVQRYIAGYVLDTAGNPMIGVTMGGLGVVTGPDGYYITRVDDGWSGTVTPLLAPYLFNPSSRDYTNVGLDLPDESYVGYIPTPTP